MSISDCSDDDALVRKFLRRLNANGAANKTVAAYAYQIRTALRVAGQIAGHSISAQQLFSDPQLLGRALVHDLRTCEPRQLSKWTLAQRRSAVRAFATLMNPELVGSTGDDPHKILDTALRGVAQRVGGGYRLTGGAPRNRGGYVPTSLEVESIINAAAGQPGLEGRRNALFFKLLNTTGSRVNALLELDASNCVQMPSGRVRLVLHEKGKVTPREVELGATLAQELAAYVDDSNRQAHFLRTGQPITLGEPGRVWRKLDGTHLKYSEVLSALRRACAQSGTTEITPHAFRRRFATDGAAALPRHIVALAGGWRGLDRFDDHYVHPRRPEIIRKLFASSERNTVFHEERDASVETIAV